MGGLKKGLEAMHVETGLAPSIYGAKMYLCIDDVEVDFTHTDDIPRAFWQCWYHQIKYFAKSYKVFAIDWPGCGESETTDISNLARW